MKILRNTWLVFQRNLGLTLGNPAWTVIGLIQPILYLLLFAPLLKSIVRTPGFPSGGAYNIFVPGLLIQLGLFGTAFVGFTLIAELRYGLVERLQVTPVSRFALLLGRAPCATFSFSSFNPCCSFCSPSRSGWTSIQQGYSSCSG